MDLFERHKIVFYFCIVFLVFANFFAWKEFFYSQENGGLKVVFLDVGQGDSVFIETLQKHQILIDGGLGSVVVEKIAKQMPFWDRSLDLVILSHPEKDHMEGLIEILKRYKTDYVLWSGVKKSDPEYLEWLKVLVNEKSKGAKIITAVAGQKIKVGNAKIDIIYPFENLFGQDAEKSANDSSIVLKVNYGKNSFLFPGDISFETEKKLLAPSSQNFLDSDVLKVAHHGSKFSSSEEFLQNVAPAIAVISAGKNNSYGHPTQETITRLENFGAQIFRTDQQGDIVLQSNGQNLFLTK